MRLEVPRLAPESESKHSAGSARAMARHPRLLAAFSIWAKYVMVDENRLRTREREIVAFRTAWRIRSNYVWSRHLSHYAQGVGLTSQELAALKRPASSHDWGAADLALIRSADALTSDFFIPDEIWAELTAHFDEEQCIDVIFATGHFSMLGMFLNTAGVQLDPDMLPDPDLIQLQGESICR